MEGARNSRVGADSGRGRSDTGLLAYMVDGVDHALDWNVVMATKPVECRKVKIRTGFVSNSSSASFVVSRSALTETQIALIKNHGKVAKILFPLDWNNEYNGVDAWEITETGSEIRGFTTMDNFDMGRFLDLIGVAAHIKHDG
jgi:hypothetical protein